jgi:hypothetical protein
MHELMDVEPGRVMFYQRAQDDVRGTPVMYRRDKLEDALWPHPDRPYRIYIEMIDEENNDGKANS